MAQWAGVCVYFFFLFYFSRLIKRRWYTDTAADGPDTHTSHNNRNDGRAERGVVGDWRRRRGADDDVAWTNMADGHDGSLSSVVARNRSTPIPRTLPAHRPPTTDAIAAGTVTGRAKLCATSSPRRFGGDASDVAQRCADRCAARRTGSRRRGAYGVPAVEVQSYNNIVGD